MSAIKSRACQLSAENGKVHITVAISSHGASHLSHLRSCPTVHQICFQDTEPAEGQSQSLPFFQTEVSVMHLLSFLAQKSEVIEQTPSFFLKILFRPMSCAMGLHTKGREVRNILSSFPNLSQQIALLRVSTLLNRARGNQQRCVEVIHNLSSN